MAYILGGVYGEVFVLDHCWVSHPDLVVDLPQCFLPLNDHLSLDPGTFSRMDVCQLIKVIINHKLQTLHFVPTTFGIEAKNSERILNNQCKSFKKQCSSLLLAKDTQVHNINDATCDIAISYQTVNWHFLLYLLLLG